MPADPPPHPLAALTAPDLEAIEALARRAIEALPEPYRGLARALPLRVEDFAPEAVLEEMGIPDAFELTGLYDGVPLTERSVGDQPQRPEAIWLFRRPILDEWAERFEVSLGDLVAHVYIHELAHHFGWSDEEIARIAPWID
jgi:predicted Zn-dependent protease with MMP-like domain